MDWPRRTATLVYERPTIIDLGDLVELTATGHSQGGAQGKCGVEADGKSGLVGHDHACSSF